MNNDNTNYYEAELMKKCIRQTCLICLNIQIGEGYACSNYSCPLWIFHEGGEITSDDLQARQEIHAEICEKIYAER